MLLGGIEYEDILSIVGSPHAMVCVFLINVSEGEVIARRVGVGGLQMEGAR